MSRSLTMITLGICCVVDIGIAAAIAQTADGLSLITVTRVEPIPVEAMNAEQKNLLGIVDGKPLPRRAQTNLFRTLAHNPQLMSLYFPLGNAVSRAPQIPAKARELLIMRIAWLYQSEYEWAQHYGPAINAGWMPEEIERIKHGPDTPGWNELERAIIMAADQLVQNSYLEDEIWTTLRQDYSVEDMMALITLVSHYHWVAMMTRTLEIELEDGKQGFDR